MISTLYQRLIDDVERRSSGWAVVYATRDTQLVSAVLFAALGCVAGALGRGLLLGLFVSEAVGQVLLAGADTRAGDGRVVYFRRTSLGRAALACFTVTAGCRHAMAYLWSGRAGWTLLVGGALVVLQLSSFGVARLRPDATASLALAGSALTLGAVLLSRGAHLAAASQLGYGALLLTGVAWLTPPAAERLNLVVFSTALACAGVGGP